jgi:hypothetical protein
MSNKMLNKVNCLLALASLSLASFGFSLPAQAGSGLFENATVSPKFQPDPIQLKGVSGGSKAASQVAGTAETPTGACLGFMDNQPDHALELTAFFKYLSISADSAADTTILVKGPGGVWCNDDFRGKNAGVSGQWLPGTYEVWVGGFAKNKSVPYVLKISETQ